jgi:Mce-associated membrane protein
MTKDDETKDDETDVTPIGAEEAPVEDATEEDATEAHGTDGVDDLADADDLDDVDELDDVDSERQRGPVRRLLLPVALAVLLLASTGVATWAYLSMYRPDQQTDGAAAARVVQAATEGTVSLLSYAPDSMDKDFANAKSHLTGDFLKYYSQFTQDIVTPAVKTKAVKTSAAVVRSALSELQPDSAEVVLYVNQTTQSKENPDGAFAASSVKVGLIKVGNDWLISKFDPV